jgi:HAD superfamily hydrolase (TIGR01509 family)
VKFAAVVFDMDGVLVDSEPMHVDAMRQVLVPYGIPYTDEDNAEFFGFTDLEVFRVLRDRYGLAEDLHELTRRRATLIVELTRKRTQPMSGVPDVPEALRALGYRMAVASSSALDVIRATVDVLGIRHLFEALVSGLEVGRGKPAPDIFVETARRLGLPPDTCLVIEDSRNGLLAAKAAGMACASIPCPATRHEDFSEADWRFAALPELLPILR